MLYAACVMEPINRCDTAEQNGLYLQYIVKKKTYKS